MIKMMALSFEERAVEQLLDQVSLLRDLKKDRFTQKKNVAVGCCPDGRQFIRSIVLPFMDMYDETHQVCFHPLSRHGGTLVLDENSPLVLPGHTTDIDFIYEIREAVEMGYRDLCLINHFPCAMARKHKIHPLCVVDSLARAKFRVKGTEGLDNITVACFLQITDGDRKRIVHIPSKDYLVWRKENPFPEALLVSG